MNFLNFSPGLVGGHCLPVDPFYLYYLANKKKHKAKFMLSGRQVNDQISHFIQKEIEIKIKKNNLKKILILGISYKANVSDLRNSLALKIYQNLKKIFKDKIFAFDPIIQKYLAKKFDILQKIKKPNEYDLIVPLVNHKSFFNYFSKDFNQENELFRFF